MAHQRPAEAVGMVPPQLLQESEREVVQGVRERRLRLADHDRQAMLDTAERGAVLRQVPDVSRLAPQELLGNLGDPVRGRARFVLRLDAVEDEQRQASRPQS